MNCKKCGAELGEGVQSCPQCGAEQQAPVNKKKLALVIGAVVLALGILAAIVFAIVVPAIRDNQDPTDPPQADPQGTELNLNGETEPQATEYVPTAEDLEKHPVLKRESYTVAEGQTPETDSIVASLGDLKLNNADFSVWYWQTYYDTVNSMGYYAFFYGLDTSKPLSEQTCTMGEVPMTWEQFMVEQTLINWHSYAALTAEAIAANMTISQEDQQSLDNLEADMTETAKAYGYASVDAMLEADYGKGVTFEAYKSFVYNLMLGNQYYSQQESLIQPTDEDVDAYYKEHSEDYASGGILQDGTPANIAVRHILIQPTTEAAADGSYSEEQMKEARKLAQEVLDQWKAGEATEDSFAVLANEKSTDPGSNTAGGLYEGVTPGQMVEAFNDWCFDPARAYGDTGLVETNYGVHVMFFVSASESSYWYETALSDYLSTKLQEMVNKAMEAHPYEADLSKLSLTFVNTAQDVAGQ